MNGFEARSIDKIQVVDTHTGGEPTRVVLSGFPNLGAGSMAERRDVFTESFDHMRSALVNEPRGSDVLVGALICEPVDPQSTAGVIFFNNVGMIGMCGHGTIGLAIALAYAGRIEPGKHRLETTVGLVEFVLHDDLESVTVTNVPSYRTSQAVSVEVPGHGVVTGDVAWGGNWFFLCADHGQEVMPNRIAELRAFSMRLREALVDQNITGRDGGYIDHVELFAESELADSRSFVLCPGGEWDRSPCGTGTSAKIACLAADGKLDAGAVWRQESVIGSVFEATYVSAIDEGVVPSITGKAWVLGESTLLLDDADPFRTGLPS